MTYPSGKTLQLNWKAGQSTNWHICIKGEWKFETETQVVQITCGTQGWENFRLTDKAAEAERKEAE
eukprot:CAMPEP_0204383886 /NCGR_PEP_ID=MMETSP0469-20131031/56388_1 /ASSEMBLY_ACC=CAM_ASM_000384 /TAXON_ID=2969 /ORGANISM="Oxyrrhis marina" /LENGTH=65 /DNA_ID=CAMNT_0051376351 /DNA_START=74 /DNA_END=268 /DNA_ORIENTATION=+